MFGSSSKKRAKKAAAQSQANFYYGELSNLVLSGRAKRLDDLEVSGAEEYNKKVDSYNTRLDQVQMQLKGKAIGEEINKVRGKYIGQIANQIKQRESNPLMNNTSGNTIQSMIQGKQTAEQRAANIIDGRNYGTNSISEMAAYFPLQSKFREDTARYQGVSTSYKDAGNLRAIYEDVSTLASGVNLSNKKNNISGQLEFKSSESGQTLAMQQKMAKKRGRNSTILTGSRG